MRWKTTQTGSALSPGELQDLADAIDMPPACARILAARGFTTPEEIESLLKSDLSLIPDPFLISGMDRAVKRLAQAVIRREKIAIFGDYDVDGVTSSATLKLFLQNAGASVSVFLPRRMVEGYGLPLSVVEEIARSSHTLLVTVDCGVTAVDEIRRAKELGMDVVVIDHHPPALPLSLPSADAIVDPHVPGGCTGFDGQVLCAAGLAFLTCMALRKTLREMGFYGENNPEPRLREFLDLTALGTIADVVPLTGVNRILVRSGLEELSRASRPGIWALKKMAGLDPWATLGTGLVSYRLAPKLNAAGRLNEATPAFDLLTTPDTERARVLAAQLEALNTDRQAVEQRIFEEAQIQALAQVSEGRLTIVVSGQGWHRGVVGIVASRLTEQFHRPAIVLAMEGDTGTGSGRSPEGGIHLADTLSKCASLLTRHGGHQRAAGLSLNASSLEDFRAAFEEAAKIQSRSEADSSADGSDRSGPGTATLPGEGTSPIPELVCTIDTDVALDEISEDLARALQRLEPFGMGNPEPVLALRNVTASCRVIQARRGGRGHLKIFIPGQRRLDIIGFNKGGLAPLVAQGPIDLAFHLCLETFQRQPKLSLRLIDLKPAEGHPVSGEAMNSMN